jgi:hypothetical protein
MKLSTGLAFFLGKYGMISGDVEFVNYGKSKYSSDTPGVSFKPDNDDINTTIPMLSITELALKAD